MLSNFARVRVFSQRLVPLAFSVTLFPILTLAQTPPAPANSSIKVTTRLVILSVVVTDKKGKPVTNLGKDDFTVLENTNSSP